MTTRRNFIKMGAAVAGAGLFLPVMKWNSLTAYAASPVLTKYLDQLPMIPMVSGNALTSLTMAPSTHSFHSTLAARPTWGYGGLSYLGPTIETMRGSAISFNAVNSLGAHPFASSIDTNVHGTVLADKTNPRVSLHLHGGNTEPNSDGYPEDTFTPGQPHQFGPYNYNNNQEAATLWYHDHAVGTTRLNVMAGLAGIYLIRDSDDPIGGNGPLGLPAGAPYEVPMVIQDRMLNPDGSLFYPPAPWAPEFFGDVSTVNGKAWPNLNVDRTLYRFRVVNGSNARFYNLSLSNRQKIIQIGTDGGMLNAPVSLSTLLLAPGERADLLIDFSGVAPGTQIVLQNDAAAPYPAGGSGIALPEIMRFTVKAGAAVPKPIPTRLRVNNPPIVPISVPPVRQRYLTLVEIMGAAGPLVALLNYVYWPEPLANPALMERPAVDTVEQWNIINLTGDAHPIHLHLVQFQILNRQRLNTAKYVSAYNATGPRTVLDPMAAGGPTVPAGYPAIDPAPYLRGNPKAPDLNEQGWKDTVQAPPGAVTRLIVPFGAQAAPNLPFGNSFKGRYVWHCHILEHEDNEMMLPYEVV